MVNKRTNGRKKIPTKRNKVTVQVVEIKKRTYSCIYAEK